MELAYKNEKCNIDMFNIALKPQSNWVSLSCGDGRTRTAVQTPHQRAFYTLSLAFVFDQGLPSDRPPKAYPLCLNGT